MSAITETTIGPDPSSRTDVGGRDAARRCRGCVRGQEYRVSGVERHRIHWPLHAPADDAVLDGRCARSRTPPPGKQPHCAEGR
jgi:hypothetical protein